MDSSIKGFVYVSVERVERVCEAEIKRVIKETQEAKDKLIEEKKSGFRAWVYELIYKRPPSSGQIRCWILNKKDILGNDEFENIEARFAYRLDNATSLRDAARSASGKEIMINIDVWNKVSENESNV